MNTWSRRGRIRGPVGGCCCWEGAVGQEGCSPEVHSPDGAAREKTGTDLKPHFEEPGRHSCLWGGELGVWRSGWERGLSTHF